MEDDITRVQRQKKSRIDLVSTSTLRNVTTRLVQVKKSQHRFTPGKQLQSSNLDPLQWLNPSAADLNNKCKDFAVIT
jgi:hypothetical protein